MAKFTVAPLAETDLEEILLYIAEHNAESAKKFIREMMRKFDLIAENPSMGTAKNDLVINLRFFVFKNYNIFYFPTENGIEIYRVLHSSRDIIQIFDDVIDETK